MKKVNYLLTGLLIAVAGIMISCKKDDALKGIVTYSLVLPNTYNSNVDGEIEFLDVFSVSVAYKNAAGSVVTENGISLPWSFSQEVEAPFTANINVTVSLRTLAEPPYEFPRPNSGNLAKITIESNGKRLSEGSPVTGTGSGLYSAIDNWLEENGHTSRTLVFTAETLEKQGSAY
ncbi:MAG: hypothetical protein LBR08_10615 [Bacteroidales bacterium]|jgi:hypothetical protein|nr:hypothetical protein [Bacteroidales bacterium]